MFSVLARARGIRMLRLILAVLTAFLGPLPLRQGLGWGEGPVLRYRAETGGPHLNLMHA